MKLRAIATNTFKEAARNKIYYLLIVFGILFAFSSKLISLLTIGDKIKVMKDVGLASIHFFSALIAIFTGINLVFKEIEKKTIFYIISKPIHRSSFILGKFLGLAMTLLVALISMALIFFLFLFLLTGEMDGKLWIYFFMLYLELLLIISLTMVFSAFSTPILSSIFTICLYLIGHVLWTFHEFEGKITGMVTKYLAYFFYYLLPNLAKFNLKNALVLNADIDPQLIFSASVYGVLYISALLVLSIMIFNKKEFQ